MSMAGQQFLAQVNGALLQAGLLAGGLGLLLGVVIARGLAAPLSRLSAAARQIARGKLVSAYRSPVPQRSPIRRARSTRWPMGSSKPSGCARHMIADIAHELRTPLTVIQGNLRAILDDVYPLEKAEIATIYDETLMLSRLVGDLRELAQAEAGRLALDIAAHRSCAAGTERDCALRGRCSCAARGPGCRSARSAPARFG